MTHKTPNENGENNPCIILILSLNRQQITYFIKTAYMYIGSRDQNSAKLFVKYY